MDENVVIEKMAADHLLKRGVSMEVRAPLFCRWFGKKTVAMTVRSPFLGTLYRVASYYLSTGLEATELKDISHEKALGLMAAHGNAIANAVACAWLNGYWAIKLFTKPVSWYLKWYCTPRDLCAIANMLLLFGGTADFMNTTRSVRLMKMKTMKPRTGQTPQGS